MHLYSEGEVPPAVRAIFEDARDAFGIPWVPEFIRALAHHPAYLEAAWPQMRPNLDQAGFAMSAAFIADRALDFVREIYEPTYTPAEAAAAVGDDIALKSTLRALHYGAPQVMLASGALLEALKFSSAGGQGRPGPRDELHAERLMRRAEVVVIDDEDASPGVRGIYAEIRAATTLPFVPVEFSSIARWPAYLRMAWDDVAHLIPHPSYRLRRRSLSYYAAGGTHYFTVPMSLGREALESAGIGDEEFDAIRSVLQIFAAAGPGQLLHTVALEHALHPRPPEVTR